MTMKISKRQLRRVIQEYGGRPYDPTVPGDQRRSLTGDAPPGSEFDAKLEKVADEIGDRAAGGYEPSIDGSPEAYADMILDVYLQNPPPPLDQMEDLEYILTKPMYREQVKNAVLEYIEMMTEGRKMRITRQQLRKIIKEEKTKVLAEQFGTNQRMRGLYIDDSMASSVKIKLQRMYENALNDIIADGEAMDESEAEELAVRAVTEVFGEFLDSIGFRYMLADLD